MARALPRLRLIGRPGQVPLINETRLVAFATRLRTASGTWPGQPSHFCGPRSLFLVSFLEQGSLPLQALGPNQTRPMGLDASDPPVITCS